MKDSNDNKGLVVDRIYAGSRNGNASDDPLPSLIGVSRGGGFRYIGKRTSLETLNLIVLKTSFNDGDWPDHLDKETGYFTYFGDNKEAGRALHETPRGGNQILQDLFSARHDSECKEHFPAILVFGSTGEYRDVRFLGLAVPGTPELGPSDDLVAIWRTAGDGNRFQNYRSIFTILDVGYVKEEWLDDVREGTTVGSPHAPRAWLDWIRHRRYRPLAAPYTFQTRTRKQQLPKDPEEKAILEAVYKSFENNSHAFERCAVELVKMMMPAVHDVDLTRPWRDGGRDALGRYRIGKELSAIDVDFSLEAKCYNPDGGGVGVKELSRLISRIRYRQFGIMVTTSYLADQAYKEVKEDGHPIVVVAGADIAILLRQKTGTLSNVQSWLDSLTSEEPESKS